MERAGTEEKGFITYSEAKAILKNELNRPVAYQRAFASVGGGACAGILLSQAWYWTPRADKKRAGWFYKTIEEWEAETGLTYSEQKKARKELDERGLIEEKRSWGNKIYFRVNITRLVNLLTGAEIYSKTISAGKIKRMENLRNNKQTTARNIVNVSTEKSESEFIEKSADKNVESSAHRFIEESARHNREYLQETTPEITSKSSTEITRNTVHVQKPRALNKKLDVDEISNDEVPNNGEKDIQLNRYDEQVSSRNTGGLNGDAALALAAFQSVGADRFDVTFLNDKSGHTQYHEAADLTVKLPRALELNETKNVSFIVRPRGASLIQIDDLDWNTVETLLPFTFLVEETSKDNFQAWLALPPNTCEDELKDTRSRLLKKLENETGNGGGYGATRFPGSINHKPERNGFRVKLTLAELGFFTTSEKLDAAGFLADASIQEYKPSPFKRKGHPSRFPNYDKCLEAKNFDRSKADASFLAICKERGIGRDEAEAELEQVSERVQEEKQKKRQYASYLSQTADFIYKEKK